MNTDDITQLAYLARIAIDTDMEQQLATDFDAILSYVGQIQEAQITKEDECVRHTDNVVHADAPIDDGVADELIAAFPDHENRFLKINQVITQQTDDE